MMMEEVKTDLDSRHLRHCNASTMSAFNRLWRLLVVIPAEENARSLETDDAMTGR
jgi:hypothetical protein